MNKEEAYKTLGLPPGSSWTEVRRAFRKLAIRPLTDRRDVPDPEQIEWERQICKAYAFLQATPEAEGEA